VFLFNQCNSGFAAKVADQTKKPRICGALNQYLNLIRVR
jgi:hypothetical protein